MAQSADYSGYFVDVLTSIRRDPTIFFSWSDGQCKELLLWLCTSDDPANPVLVGHDYTVLHCLLRTPTFPIDCPLKPPGRHKETAFSLAVEGGHFELGKYLLKMGASPDVLIGWDPVLHRESYFALDRMVDTKAELVWRDFILQFCKTPCREAEVDNEVEADWARANFDHGVEYDISQIKTDPSSLESWSRLHAAFVFARLVKRRPGGATLSDFSSIDAILEGGKVGVDDYLVDQSEQRMTALHEAVSRKNIPFVKFLLQSRRADPNKLSYVDAMPWNDETHIVTPLGVSLRGFLLWDDGESEAIRQIINLLLEVGISEDSQIETIDGIWHDNVLNLMDQKEAWHFVRMVALLVSRTPGIVGRLKKPLSYSVPMLLVSCETKWIKETYEDFHGARNQVFTSTLDEGVRLLASVSHLDPSPITLSIVEHIIAGRCYRTLAALVVAFGRALPLAGVDFSRVQLTPLLTDDMLDAGLTHATALAVETRRVTALVAICAVATTAAATWRGTLLRLCRRAFAGPELVKLAWFTFKVTGMAGVNDAKRDGWFTEEEVKGCLPVGLYHDLSVDKHFLTLDSLV